jgi:hypothetical protein
MKGVHVCVSEDAQEGRARRGCKRGVQATLFVESPARGLLYTPWLDVATQIEDASCRDFGTAPSGSDFKSWVAPSVCEYIVYEYTVYEYIVYEYIVYEYTVYEYTERTYHRPQGRTVRRP